jgi:hypothetical protein
VPTEKPGKLQEVVDIIKESASQLQKQIDSLYDPALKPAT